MIKIEARRTLDGVDTNFEVEGTTNDVLAELAAATADAVIALADDMHTEDLLHESMTNIVCAEIKRAVYETMATRERQAEDKQEDAYNEAH